MKNEFLNSNLKGCVIMPAFCEERRIKRVVLEVKKYIKDVVVVDDGSADATSEEAKAAGALVIKHPTNLGKGMALATGFKFALEKQYAFVITMDADGQHSPEDLYKFIETYRNTQADVIIGNRMDNPDGMPFVRRLTNKFMSWYLSRLIGQFMPDTQNGYRLYSAKVLPTILQARSSRFATESEVLFLLSDRKIKITSLPVKVIYGDEKSKINPFRDTLRFIQMIYHFKNRNKKS